MPPTPAAAAEPWQTVDLADVEDVTAPTPGILPPAPGESERVAAARAAATVQALGLTGGDDEVDGQDVRRAARALDVDGAEGPVTNALAQQVRTAHARHAATVLDALDVVDGVEDAPVGPADVRAAAAMLDVEVDEQVDPADVGAVMAAAEVELSARRRESVRPYLDALGLGPGLTVDEDDVAALGERLGIELSADLRGAARRRVHEAWLQTLTGALDRMGVPHGEAVTADDVRTLGRLLGRPVDEVTPSRVRPLLVEAGRRPASSPVFATVGDVPLRLPSRDVAGAGFHEATRSSSAPMAPVGDDLTFDLPSRGRGTDARSAIDVAVAEDSSVLSPVAGTVTEVVEYRLYDEHPDTRIRIAPDDAPAHVVTLLHVTGAQVEVGDRVRVGDVVADHATLFPFSSQIDRVVGRLPHVHMEVADA